VTQKEKQATGNRQPATGNRQYRILVHGGAGRISEDRYAAAEAGVREAARVGIEVLAGGGSAIDAVQAAVRALEDCPDFNAGTGSVLSREGTVELDASIMGGDGRVGAVAAVPDLKNAVDLARAILEDGEHVLLAGPAAWAFGRERGFAPVATESLITERARARFAEKKLEVEGGTVGAVAIDGEGRVAAATSTGGILFKRPGRVGDSALPGCGTWADDAGGAASATGDGEKIIRVTLTRMLVERMVSGAAPEDAAREAIEELARRASGTGGVIAIDRHGRPGAFHNTDTMPVGAGVVAGGAVRVTAWVRPPAVPAPA
jgi:beta-aspartyl-peptidase (threonine type)